MSAMHADRRERRERALDAVRRHHQDQVDALARATAADRSASGTIGGVEITPELIRFWRGDDVLDIHVRSGGHISRHMASVPRADSNLVALVAGYLTHALAGALAEGRDGPPDASE